eukprot:14540652-Alexandrium_andersonii.AAC.1
MTSSPPCPRAVRASRSSAPRSALSCGNMTSQEASSTGASDLGLPSELSEWARGPCSAPAPDCLLRHAVERSPA